MTFSPAPDRKWKAPGLLKSALLLSLLILNPANSCKVKDHPSDSKPITHELWDLLVRKHVTPEGLADYKGFLRDSADLNAYLNLLQQHHPNERSWNREERLAYWINAYNAFTVKLIIDHYPLKGIKEIKNGIPFVNTVWDIRFIRIEDRVYDLNNIEHGILRAKFDEPRIHFAINCASLSCPKLRNEAYKAGKLNAQLDEQTRDFLSDTTRNIIQAEHLRISRIFLWFGGDFKKDGSLIDFINRFSDVEVRPDAGIDYLNYNWNLNDLPSGSSADK